MSNYREHPKCKIYGFFSFPGTGLKPDSYVKTSFLSTHQCFA